VMLLDHLGLAGDAGRLDDAITAVYAAGEARPADQGGTAGTTEFAEAVVAALDSSPARDENGR
jgi:isocitrate/isopropylmalate dehydrogenase